MGIEAMRRYARGEVEARPIDRAGGEARGWPGLAFGEWAVAGAAGVLLLSMTAFDWFAFSDREQIAAGSEGDAFRWLDGLDYVVFAVGLAALAAPLVRMTGLMEARPRDVAVVTGSAGLIAALVIAGVIASPPDLERGFLNVSVGGGPTAETVVRGGAILGLLAALGIVVLSALTIVASPAALAPVHRPAPSRSEPPQQAQEPIPVAAAPEPKPRPKPAPRKRTAKPKPKPPARKRVAKPKPRSKPRPPSKAPARPSLATATVEDLVGVGFTPLQAERIVEYRDDLGKVTKLADLKRVPGIAKPVLAELVKRLDD